MFSRRYWLVALFSLMFLLLASPALAIEIPPLGAQTYIQTNGPAGAITLGDWYSSNVNGVGGGYHYFEINIPCSWPAATPIFIDLFSPEMNSNSPLSDEIAGAADNTQFELYAAGTVITTPNQPAPGGGGSLVQTTFVPAATPEQYVRFATLAAPVACGAYVLRAQTFGDDQNGWRLRVGADNDANPNNAPPANSDNPDGLPGTDDEISLGIRQTSFQHDVPQPPTSVAQCLTLYEYVAPGQATVTFHNFDLDGNQLVTYYAPGDPAYNPLGTPGGVVGTVSTNGVWNNGGTQTARVGDTINNPAPGWWRVVTCVNNHNQYIQESQTAASAYYAQPATPRMTVAKDDGQTTVAPGQVLTYTINFANVSNIDPSPGAATNVVLTDPVPANTTFQACAINAPFTGTCGLGGGVVTYQLAENVNAGASGSVTLTVQVNAGAAGTLVNQVTLNYQDSSGRPILPETATDTDTITAVVPAPAIDLVKSVNNPAARVGDTVTYTYVVTNTGNVTLDPVTVTDNRLGNITLAATILAPSASTTGTATYTIQAGDLPLTNIATTSGAPVGGGPAVTDSSTVTIPAAVAAGSTPAPTPGIAMADPIITKSVQPPFALPGAAVTWTITVTNPGNVPATNIVVNDSLPAEIEILSASASAGNLTVNGQNVHLTLASLAPGGRVTVTVQARVRNNVQVPFIITNLASLTADGMDPASAEAQLLSVKNLPSTGESPLAVWRLPLLLLVTGAGLGAYGMFRRKRHTSGIK
jgi:uncharacterized repeat protein (TIGR01451 family)